MDTHGVSTAEQAKGGDSLDTQRQQITGYAVMKGWAVAEFFREGGVSGSTPLAERPESKRLPLALTAHSAPRRTRRPPTRS
jgi:putative DNA-invertase from lambdoid prophage Rac